MASVALRLRCLQRFAQTASYTTLLKRPLAYKSSISLETLYPNSSLKLTSPAFSADPNEKFNGFIPIEKLDITYSASSGPGGQNVNKVHTKVDLRFKPSEADWLHPDVKQRVLELHGSKLTREGYLIIRSDTTRSQQLNLADCMKKLRDMLRSAAHTQTREPSPETAERIRQSEAMRVLGFPQPISLESFRVPNWELMEECLRWVARRVECDAELPRGGPEHRVALVTQAIALFHSRANLKLNGKRLYGADGWAVRELLKVATFLREALSAPPPAAREEAAATYDVSSRLGEIKQARALSTDITAQGAFLYDLLAKEVENKDIRESALSRPLDMSAMEACLRRALDAVSTRVAAARDQIDNVAASEAALDAKLERRRAELQRAEKRLHTVQKIKPAYAGELSALESEISVLWDRYVVRYRCVEALKHQLSVLETAQAEAAEEQQAAIMQLIHKYEAEDVLGKLSDSEESSSSDDGKDLSEPKHPPRPATRPKTRLRIKTASGGGAEARRAFGSMAGARDSLDDIRDEDDSRSDSDFSDTQLYGGEGGSRWSHARARPVTRTIAPADDDDFADLIEGVERGGGGAAGGGSDSLGSSSESELRVTSAAAERHQLPLSDNEF